MKLYFSVNSPYARKCRVLVLEKGLQNNVEFVDRMPLTDPIPPDLLAANPLGRVPALELDDGTTLTESALICEYLDSLSAPHLFPKEQKEYFVMRRFLALNDGILDAAVHCRLEAMKPPERQTPEWVARKEKSIVRTLGTLEGEIPAQAPITMATIGFGVMLAYLDLRLPHLDWRKAHPTYADWLKTFSTRPSMLATTPQ